MSVNIKPVSEQSFRVEGGPSQKQLKLPTQKESFEQVLAKQLDVSVRKKTPTQAPPTNQIIERQSRSLHLNHGNYNGTITIEIMDDKSEHLIRKIANQTINQLIKEGDDYAGSLINTQA